MSKISLFQGFKKVLERSSLSDNIIFWSHWFIQKIILLFKKSSYFAMVWEVLVVQSCQHKQPIGCSHSAAFIKYSLFALKHKNICLTWAATQVNSVTKIVPFLHLHHLGLPFKDSVRSPFLVLYTWTFKGFPYLLWFLRVVSYFILLFFVGLCVVFPYFRPLDWKPCKIKLLSQSSEKNLK